MWDFSLKLEDEYKNSINAWEYFENSLAEQKGSSEKIEARNRIWWLIKHFFKEWDCATLVRPSEEEKDLQNLQEITDENLRPEFVKQMN